jgi:scyllo-inositol 2-dehydrogenase (NADP+)
MSGLVFHGPLLKSHLGFAVHKIVQRREPTALKHWPSASIVKSADEIFGDSTIELVVVNTPNETHFDFASKALKAGKHVIVEKPFTVTIAEADALIELAARNKRVLTVFQNRRWDGDFLTVQKVLKENGVGRVAEFEAHYDRFRNYIEPNTWKEEIGHGSGILYNLGSHMLDQSLALFGMPEEVDARVGIQREGGRVDDFYDIRLRHKSFYSIVKSSYLVREPGPRYILHGSDGSFVKYGLDPQEQALKDGHLPGAANWGKEPEEWWGKLNNSAGVKIIETIAGNYRAFYENVYAAIREGKELAVKPEESRDGIRLIEVCYESNRLKKAIKL